LNRFGKTATEDLPGSTFSQFCIGNGLCEISPVSRLTYLIGLHYTFYLMRQAKFQALKWKLPIQNQTNEA
jgi:hypothetical protein